MPESRTSGGREPEPLQGVSDQTLHVAENAVYVLTGVVLAASALVLLGAVAYRLVTDLGDGTQKAVTSGLDGLLLVFIMLELLAGVRTTIARRELVAEPFLVAGMIAAIKEIIVASIGAKEARGRRGSLFEDTMLEIGVLAGVVVVLAVAMLLVRRKEREPSEE